MEEAGVHPARSLILKALQGQADVEPDLQLLEVEAGDRLLVCSDGLTGVVSDETLHQILGDVAQLDDTADELIRLALAGGAPDNVTLVLADVVAADAPRQPDDTAEAYLVGAAAGQQPPKEERPHRRRPRAALRTLLGSEEKPTDPDEIEALRYAPQPPRRRRWLRPGIIAFVVALLGWVGLNLANDWIREQYYVAESAGQVAIFQGVSQEVGPIRLSDLYEVPGGLPVDALPELYRDQVDETITTDNVDDAQAVVDKLRRQACQSHERLAPSQESASTPGTTPQSTSSPTPTPGPTASSSPDALPDDGGWLGSDVGYPGLLCAGTP